MRILPILLLAAACSPMMPTVAPPVSAPPPVPAPQHQGLERVLGHNAAEVIEVIGSPTLDRIEGKARQLQFARGPCVLDLFLYSATPGAEPRVKYAYARLKDGKALDTASCLQSQIIAVR